MNMPMCSRCKKNIAVVFITKIEGPDKTTQEGLCLKCAAQLGLPQVDEMMKRMGITPEDLPKIFERFYRSDSARKSESGGHGLGLSIARIIVIAHSGKIRVRSKPGVGTTFAIQLPATQEKLHKTEA